MLYHGGYISQYLSCRPPTLNPSLSFEIEVTSDKAGVSPNPPPFEGGYIHVFSPYKPGNDPNPDKHFVVFYKDVVDSGFTVENFSIKLEANITYGVSSSVLTSLNPRWTKLSGPASGALSANTGVEVNYDNPKMGGVYKFAFDLDGYPRTEFCVVLPLSGAEMDARLQSDLFMANDFAVAINKNHNGMMKRLLSGRWFWIGGAGDYLGRPDNSLTPTVWLYNQVNDKTGMGAFCTWKTRPVRLTKPTNFILGYAMQKIGFSRTLARRLTRVTATSETTDRASVGAGWDVANSGHYATTVSALVDYIWTHEDENDEVRRVWPNPNTPTNPGGTSTHSGPNYNTQYSVPGFLFMTQ